MGNIVEKIMNFMRLSYDEEYDEGEEEAFADERQEKKGRKKEEETEAGFSQRESQIPREPAPVKNRESRFSGFSSGTRTTPGPVPVSPSRKTMGKGGNNMESEIVSIRPTGDQSNKEIGDSLLQGKTVVINLDGLDLAIAQRIVDFTAGVCYAIHGDMKFPSKYIVIAVPDAVNLKGAFENGSSATSGSSQTPF